MALALAAAPAIPRAGEATTTIFADVVGRYGPAAAMVLAGGTRRWTREDGPSALEQGRYAQLGGTVGVNPAYAQGSIAAEWVPVALLQLRLQYDVYGFFGASGALLRLPSKDARFGERELDALAGKEEAGVGHRVLFSPVLRARFGRMVLRNQTDLDGYVLSRARGWYYESEYDTVLSERDWLVANRTALLVDLLGRPGGATFLAGPMYDVTHAGAAGITRQRVGAALFLEPAGRWLGLDRVRVYALGGVNLSDRNRRGEPFALVGLGGELDVAGAVQAERAP
jgi:hypothetical protein